MIFQYFTRTIGLTVCAMFLTVAATYGQAPNVRPKAAPKGAAKAEAPLAPSGPDVAVLGRVAFKGQAPVFKPIAMDSEPSCAAKHSAKVYPETVVVNPNSTLKNV